MARTAGSAPESRFVADYALAGIITKARLRPADPERVEALAASMAAEGLLQPVGVRLLSPGGNAQLIYGLHRLEAARRLGWTHLPALVFKRDAPAVEMEALENLCRAELSPYDRAVAVRALRRQMLESAGLSLEQDPHSVSAAGRHMADASAKFAVAELASRVGRGKRSVEDDLALARSLHPALAAVMRGRAGWDTASIVQSCARLSGGDLAQASPTEQQLALQQWLSANPDASLRDGLSAVLSPDAPPAPDAAAKAWSGTLSNWTRTGRAQRPELVAELMRLAPEDDRPDLVLEAARVLDGAQLGAVIASLELAYSMTPEGQARAAVAPPLPPHPLDPATGEPMARRSSDR